MWLPKELERALSRPLEHECSSIDELFTVYTLFLNYKFKPCHWLHKVLCCVLFVPLSNFVRSVNTCFSWSAMSYSSDAWVANIFIGRIMVGESSDENLSLQTFKLGRKWKTRQFLRKVGLIDDKIILNFGLLFWNDFWQWPFIYDAEFTDRLEIIIFIVHEYITS